MKKLVMFGVLGVASVLAFASISGALATGSNTSTASPVADPSVSPTSASQDIPFGIGTKSWADIGAEEFANLPAGTRIEDCSPEHKRMPMDLRMESGPGGPAGHYLLSDGRCAFDPSAKQIPTRQDNVDPKVP